MRVMDWPELFAGRRFQPEPAPDQIHLWQSSVAVSPAILKALDGLLSNDERARAGRFRFQRDHDSYVLLRGLLRQLPGCLHRRRAGTNSIQLWRSGQTSEIAGSAGFSAFGLMVRIREIKCFWDFPPTATSGWMSNAFRTAWILRAWPANHFRRLEEMDAVRLAAPEERARACSTNIGPAKRGVHQSRWKRIVDAA